MKVLNKRDNLAIQSYATANLIFEISKKNDIFLESEFYKNEMPDSVRGAFNSESNVFRKIDKDKKMLIFNQGSVLMLLYSLLVVPWELFEKNKYADFNILDSEISKYATVFDKSTYKYDAAQIQFSRHIRNAISHMKIKFEQDKLFFTDSYSGTDKTTGQSIYEKVGFSIKLVDFPHIVDKIREFNIVFWNAQNKLKPMN